jgi:type VI secretion system secreted protein VgrG
VTKFLLFCVFAPIRLIVDFLEGDPDQPIITGRVYNAEQIPPYALPANATQIGIQTRSSKGGSAANFNEIRFEDKKGQEELYVHAERDVTIMVEHDETKTVQHDQKQTIQNNRTATVLGTDSETIARTQTYTVGSSRTTTIASSALSRWGKSGKRWFHGCVVW